MQMEKWGFSCMENDVTVQCSLDIILRFFFLYHHILMVSHIESVIIWYFSFWQGKGLMNTYWLTCREGPIKKREEISWFADIEPVFMKNLQTSLHEVRAKSRKSVKL